MPSKHDQWLTQSLRVCNSELQAGLQHKVPCTQRRCNNEALTHTKHTQSAQILYIEMKEPVDMRTTVTVHSSSGTTWCLLLLLLRHHHSLDLTTHFMHSVARGQVYRPMTKAVCSRTSHPWYLLWGPDNAQQESSTRTRTQKESVREAWVRQVLHKGITDTPLMFCTTNCIVHCTFSLRVTWEFRNREWFYVLLLTYSEWGKTVVHVFDVALHYHTWLKCFSFAELLWIRYIGAGII